MYEYSIEIWIKGSADRKYHFEDTVVVIASTATEAVSRAREDLQTKHYGLADKALRNIKKI